MFAPLVLAAAMTGQLADNTGKLWTGTAWAVVTLDTARPLKFQGGSISAELKWEPSKAMFESAPVACAGRTVVIQFWANPKFDMPQAWILYVQGVDDLLPFIDDSDYVFDSASGPPLNLSSHTAWMKGWILNRAGAANYTLTQ